MEHRPGAHARGVPHEGLIELECLAKDVMMGGGISHAVTIAIWHKR